jgi:hypothetical protein
MLWECDQRWRVTGIVLTVIASACGTAVPSESPAQAFARIRARHDLAARAQAKRGTEPASFGYGDCPTSLEGATQPDVLAQLGTPDGKDPCRVDDSRCLWAYYFYYLPPSRLGGGPELHLYFDSSHHVERVECVATQ